MNKASLTILSALIATATCHAEVPSPHAATDSPVNRPPGPLLQKDVARPLRYRPEGTDFVIENGTELFNRPLYGNNTAFRIDAGDQPEFGLYLPGRGGVLRLGIRVGEKAKWLNDAEQVVARYRPGSMVYEIRDPLLGKGVLRVTALGLADSEGLIVRAEIEGAENVALLSAFGGANGEKGSHNVDFNCGAVPVTQWWKFKPEYCTGNQFTFSGPTFLLKSKAGSLSGMYSADTKLALGNAENWNNPVALQAGGAEPATPVAVGITTISPKSPAYIVLKPLAKGAKEVEKIPAFTAIFSAAETHRREIAEHVVVDTPDLFINAADGALCVAADAIWDGESRSWLHGAIAWRRPYLGWRGPYTGHALGWHDRSEQHFSYWGKKQLTKPEGTNRPGPDEKWNLSRSQSALMTSGMFPPAGSAAYDMNLVYIDALLRHLLWTGDVEFANEMWPVIERHFEWEQRLFRREFTTTSGEKLPLYEGYCNIWASDDLWYSGGGTSHASAYNFFHNKVAARLARIIGKDPTPYEREAELIAKGMRAHLWLEQRGLFAESKDLLGLQRAREHPAVWTFYHTIDSEVPYMNEAQRMLRYVDENIAHIPIKGPGVPDDRNYFTLATTNWLPYAWSINNVSIAESAHTALAYWLSDRSETAFDLFKGTLLDSMFMSMGPGNISGTTQFDAGNGDRMRDFGDGVGSVSRALVEGLFGLKPDALAGELTVRPGFPADWDHASIKHPDVELAFKRDGLTETFSVRPKFGKPMTLRLEAAPLREGVASITVNGQPSKWEISPDSGRIIITALTAEAYEVVVKWQGDKLRQKQLPPASLLASPALPATDWTKPVKSATECINLADVFNDKVTQIFKNEYRSPRSPFASLSLPKQGYGSWCKPTKMFDVDDTGLRALAAKNKDRIALPNGLLLQTPAEPDAKNIAFVSLWDNYPDELTIPLGGKASHAYLLMAGSTNPMQSRIDNGEVVVTYADGSTERLPLQNPTTWWPIDQDYVIDDFAFRYDGPIPPRVDLKTGNIRFPKREDLQSGPNNFIPGGAATVLDLPLDPTKELKSLTIRALSNEVVIGLMSVTLLR